MTREDLPPLYSMVLCSLERLKGQVRIDLDGKNYPEQK